MTAAATLTLSCLCGACKFTAEVPAESKETIESRHRYFCHCDSCRHTTGAFALTSIAWPAPVPHTTLAAHPHLVGFAFSKTVTFHFCRVCGGHMLISDSPGPPDVVDAMTGALVGAAPRSVFTSHQYVGDTRDGGLATWLPRMGGRGIKCWVGDGGASEIYNGAKGVAAEGNRGEEKTLKAFCKCRGVQFEVTRPDETSAQNPYPDANNPKIARGVWWLDSTRTKYLGGLCGCTSCRLAGGGTHAPFPWAFITLSNMRTVPSGAPYSLEDAVAAEDDESTLRAYKSSAGAMRYFCGRCGAVVFYQGLDRPGLLDVAVGVLDAPKGARAENWLAWRTDTVNYRADALDADLVENLLEGMAAAKGGS